MPVTTVSAPQPASTRLDLSNEPDGVLAKRVAAQGLCVPGPTGEFAVSAVDDPWFPIEENSAHAINLARAACQGCPAARGRPT